MDEDEEADEEGVVSVEAAVVEDDPVVVIGLLNVDVEKPLGLRVVEVGTVKDCESDEEA